MSLGARLILIAVGLVLVAALATWQVFDRMINGVIEQWGTQVAEVQVRYDSARLLRPLEREIALARQMADSPIIQDLAHTPDNDNLFQNALAEMERFRGNFGANNYFIAYAHNGAYYYNNADNEFADQRLRYYLSEDDPDDAWFYRLIEQGRDIHLNVNPDTELNVTKLWIDVLMRDRVTNDILGIVGTGIDLETILAETVAIDQPGITTIFVDHGGAIQLYRDRNFIEYASLVKPEGQKNHLTQLISGSESRQHTLSLLETAKTTPGDIYTAFVSVENKRHLMGIVWLPSVGWYEVTLMDLDVIMPSSHFMPLLLTGISILMISIVLLHVAVRRFVLKPISQLEAAMQALKGGYYDSRELPKGNGEMARLIWHFRDMANTIQTHTNELESRVEARTAELDKLARFDLLTDLLNRRGTEEALKQTCLRAKREEQPLCLLWLDIDRFKLINDNHGHKAGDLALQQVADCLREQLRPYDVAGRWGGDEFLIMLYPSTHQDMQQIAERLRHRISEQVSLNGEPITVSVGGYCTNEAEALADILAYADRALYKAKSEGRNRICTVKVPPGHPYAGTSNHRE
ncbi:MAG: diguanylate cyclase [Pseudomonadota bacterium]